MTTTDEVTRALLKLLKDEEAPLLEEAREAVERTRMRRYEESGRAVTAEWLKALHALVIQAVGTRHLEGIVDHAREVARERYAAGFELSEVQTAFNVLEEAIWHRILRTIPPDQQATALGLVSTVLGAGKDTLARTYVSLASSTHAPSLNLQALFKGTDGV